MKSTKKFVWYLLFFLPIIFQACSNDDEPTPEELLIGTWTLSKQETEVFANGIKIPESFYKDYIDTDSIKIFPEGSTVEFKSDNSYFLNAADQTETGTWALSGDAKTLTIDPDSSSDNLVFDVDTLTKNSAIVIYSLESDLPDPNGSGNTIKGKIVITANFTK